MFLPLQQCARLNCTVTAHDVSILFPSHFSNAASLYVFYHLYLTFWIIIVSNDIRKAQDQSSSALIIEHIPLMLKQTGQK